MSIFPMAHLDVRKACLGALAVIAGFTATAPAFATGPQCQPRYVAQNIKDAVLALKATEYCVGTKLPYTQAQIWTRIESLRCGPDANALLESMINTYDKQYRLIMTQDSTGVVCNQAAALHFD